MENQTVVNQSLVGKRSLTVDSVMGILSEATESYTQFKDVKGPKMTTAELVEINAKLAVLARITREILALSRLP